MKKQEGKKSIQCILAYEKLMPGLDIVGAIFDHTTVNVMLIKLMGLVKDIKDLRSNNILIF